MCPALVLFQALLILVHFRIWFATAVTLIAGEARNRPGVHGEILEVRGKRHVCQL